MKNVVIIGGGFGGVYTALNLSKLFKKIDIKIYLIDKKNYFIFVPLIHEIAVGKISIDNAIVPYIDILNKNIEFLEGEVDLIDLDKKIINVKSFYGNIKLNYHYLVIATGSKTNFFNIKGAQSNSYELKSLQDALRLKNKLLDLLEICRLTEKEININIIGGGATEVELSAEIADLVYYYKNIYKNLNVDKIKINLIDKNNDVLIQFDPRIREKARNKLIEKKINLFLNKEVEEIGESYIKFKDGYKINSDINIWVAGVAPNLPNIVGDIKLDKTGKIIVNEYLQVKDYKEVFALGDCAYFLQNNKPLPNLAQVAFKQSKTVALNIYNLENKKELKKFIYKHTGDLISLGDWYAIGKIYGTIVSGKFFWWLWRTVYLFKIPTLKKKIKLAIDWTFNLFYNRDISKI